MSCFAYMMPSIADRHPPFTGLHNPRDAASCSFDSIRSWFVRGRCV